MVKIYDGYISNEIIKNYTICVIDQESGKIRNIKYRDDINGRLVYIDIIPRTYENGNDLIATYGDCVRCLEIDISKKEYI